MKTKPENRGSMEAISSLSVCLCTHDPRRDHMERVMAALAAQTLDRARWECIVIDNASRPPVASWLGTACGALAPRIVREERLGVVHARMRAAVEASAAAIVFVDDDNLLAADYLAQVIDLLNADPALGAFAGRNVGEFETPPPAWLLPFLRYLSIGDAGDRPIRGVKGQPYGPWYPRGAGMAVRTAAARRWAGETARDPERLRLGRFGAELGGGEDTDIVTSVLDQGLAAAYCPQLRLTHLIPSDRLTFDYMARLVYNTHLTNDRIDFMRKTRRPPRPWPLEYLASVFLYLRAGAWCPKSWLLAMQLARGRYEAWQACAPNGQKPKEPTRST